MSADTGMSVDETLSRLSLGSATARKRPQKRPTNSRKRNKPASKEPRILNTAPVAPLKVFVFGAGESGELGLGVHIINGKSPDLAPRPRHNHFLDARVVQISVGGMHCAALMRDGTVFTWGVNDSKALGRNTTWQEPEEAGHGIVEMNPLESTPMALKQLEDAGAIVQVAATDNATFVLTCTGEVYGWGSFFGDNGAFGFSNDLISGGSQPSHADKFSSIPIHIGGLSNIKELATGVNHLLALSHDGAVYSCGSGHQAELGRRVLSRRPYAALEPRVIFSSRHLIKRIFAGFNHSFAIDSQERVYSWGLNNFGQTGHGIDSYNSHVVSPAIVDSLGGLGIRELAPGFHHTLACTEDGTLLAWGRCDDSQLGVSLDEISTADIVLSSSGRPCAVSVPTKVPGIDAIVSVAAGIDNSLAVARNGKVYSWGFSDGYRTGLGTEDSVKTPTLLHSDDLAEGRIIFAGCGGQFSVIAGPAGQN